MGKTYQKSQNRGSDDDNGRSDKQRKHSNGKKTGGMRELNSYVEEDYDPFEEELEIRDNIFIQHTKS